MQPEKIINIKRAVSKVKYIGDGIIGIIDEENTIRLYDANNFKLIDGFKIKFPKNNPKENSVNFSANGKYVAVAVQGKYKTTIWAVKEKKLLYTLGWHKGDVLSVDFDREEKYLITGAEDGRSYIWSLKTGKMVSSLPPHADYITKTPSSLTFVPELNYLVVGTFDGEVYFYDLFKEENELKEYIQKNDYEKAYELLSINPFLKKTETYKLLEEKWEKLLLLTQKKFEAGETDIAKQILSLLVKSYKGEKIDQYFKKSVINYIKLFGFDMEISDLIEKAKKLKIELNLGHIEEGNMNTWHKYKLPNKIWEEIK